MANVVVLRFVGDDKSLDAAFKRVQTQAVKTNSVLASMGKFSKGMTQVGKGLTQYVTLPVAAAGIAATKLATDFQTSMTHVRTLVGASQKQVAQWSDQILKLAPIVGKSPRELADALYFITSSGISASKAMTVLTYSAKASAAGLGATTTVADAVTSAMNAYGQSNLDAKHATDVLLATVRDGKAEPEQLAKAIGRVVSPAALLGVTFKEVGAATAAMTDTGLDAFTSTTALRQIFVTLIKPASQTSKEMAKIGLSAAGLRSELREKGLLATLQTLKQHGEGNVAVFGKLFPNVRALNGFLSMMGPNLKQTDSIFKDLAKDGNDTNKAFDIWSTTAGANFRKALAALEVAAIRVGNDVLPLMTRLATAVGDLAQKFADLSPHTRKMIEEWALVAAAVGPSIFLLGKLGMGLTAIAKHPIITVLALLATEFIHLYTTSKTFREDVDKVASVLASATKTMYDHRAAIVAITAGFAAFFAVIKGYELIMAIAAAISGFAGVAATATTVVKGLRGAMLLLNLVLDANPVFLIATAIGVLVAAFVTLWQRSDSFRNFWKEAWADMEKVVGNVAGFIVQALGTLETDVLDFAGTFIHAIATAFGWVPKLGSKLKGASKAFDDFKSGVTTSMNDLANKLYGFGETAGGNLGAGLSQGIDASYKTHVLTSTTKMADGTIKRTMTRFSIASPSKVMRKLGQWIGQGLALGITDSTVNVLKAAQKQADKTLDVYHDAQRRLKQAMARLNVADQGHWAGKGKKRHWVGPSASSALSHQQAITNAKAAAADALQAYKDAMNGVSDAMAQAQAEIVEKQQLDARRAAGSPLMNLASSMLKGLEVGAGTSPIAQAADTLANAIQSQFADKDGKVPTAVQAAMDQLSNLSQQVQQFRDSFAQSMHGAGSFMQAALTSTDANGVVTQLGAGGVVSFLGDKLKTIQAFAANLRTLAARGMPRMMLKELMDAGLDGANMADVLAHSSDSDFNQILALQQAYNQATSDLSAFGESTIYGGGLAGVGIGKVALGSTDTGSIQITVNAQTGADPNQIANEIAWALKTGGS